jgi:hypothetical protein
MYTRLQFGVFAALAALGIFVLESSPADGAAQNKGAKKAANAFNHASILSDLHHAKHLLDLGLHDYHGHRAKADHEVHRAIHLLQHGKHHNGEHHANFKATIHHGPITPEMQNASDSKLRQAEKFVQSAHLQLVQLHDRHKHDHHREAAHLLTKAVSEIEQALHVVHNYNHHHKNAVVVK